jgi:uncharacterized coiled-coil DUF342 family protein
MENGDENLKIQSFEEDPETRDLAQSLLDSMDEKDDVILESLSNEDRVLVQTIYVKIKSLVQGSVLLSFLEIRRQIKAVQRELADFRKQYDREIKKKDQEIDRYKKDMSELASSISEMSKKIDALHETEMKNRRTRFWFSQRDAIEKVSKIAEKIGI